MIALCCVHKAYGIFLQSPGKPKMSMFLSLLREFILNVPLALALPLAFGVTGALYSTPVAQVISFIAAVLCIRHTSRMLRKEDSTGGGNSAAIVKADDRKRPGSMLGCQAFSRGDYPSIAIYLLFSIAFISSLFGTESFKIPFSNLALMSLSSTFSPT